MLFALSLSGHANIPKKNTGPGLTLPPIIHSDLLSLINEAAELHRVIQESNVQPLKVKIQELQNRIRLIYRKLPLIAHPQKKDHAFRLLGIIDEKLEGLKIQGKDKTEKKSVKKLFGTIAELARTYHVKTASNGIFYCSLDRSLWLQSGRKPKNPVNPQLKNCGRRVW